MAIRNIYRRIRKMKYRSTVPLACVFCILGTLAACGQEPAADDWGPEAIPIESEKDLTGDDDGNGVSPAPEADSPSAGTGQSGYFDTAIPETDAMKEMFGEDCISEQTFSGYQEAYEAVSRVYDLGGEGRKYNLIYFDEDDIPELVAGVNGYFMSLYTYDGGRVYCLMDDWGYGAMGNAGYEYVPGKNSLRNYDADFAGAIVYTTYMAIGEQHSLELVASIKSVFFDDVNGNGQPDEEEMESMGYYGVNYIDGVEATDEECAAYDAGEYEFIESIMSLEELREKLGR